MQEDGKGEQERSQMGLCIVHKKYSNIYLVKVRFYLTLQLCNFKIMISVVDFDVLECEKARICSFVCRNFVVFKVYHCFY